MQKSRNWIFLSRKGGGEVDPWEADEKTIKEIPNDSYLFEKKEFTESFEMIFSDSFDVATKGFNPDTLLSAEKIINEEFDLFLKSQSFDGKVDTGAFIQWLDNWKRQITATIDYILYENGTCVISVPIVLNNEIVDGPQAFDNYPFARYVIQYLEMLVSQYKANVFVNNRESTEILYIPWADGAKHVVAEREKLEKSFGKVKEKLKYNDVRENINYLFGDLISLGRKVIEINVKNGKTDSATKCYTELADNIHTWIRNLLRKYFDLSEYTNEVQIYSYYEETIFWLEIIQYCFSSFFVYLVRKLSTNDVFRHLCDYEEIQSFYTDHLAPLFDKIREEFRSNTNDEEYDKFHNRLTAVHIDRRDVTISSIGIDFIPDDIITIDKWKEILQISDSNDEIIEMAMARSSEEAKAIFKDYLREKGIALINAEDIAREMQEKSSHQEDAIQKEESDSRKFDTIDHSKIAISEIFEYTKRMVEENSEKRNNRIKVFSLTLEDFEYAIYNADFSKLSEEAEKHKAKELPYVIIVKLKAKFDPRWYNTSCSSIKKKAAEVSAYHRTGFIGKYAMQFVSKIVE